MENTQVRLISGKQFGQVCASSQVNRAAKCVFNGHDTNVTPHPPREAPETGFSFQKNTVHTL